MTKFFEPPPSEEAQPFWDATRDQRLVLPWCTACGVPYWYPRPSCPRWLSDAVEWKPASGTAQVYAASVMHRPGPFRDEADGPYAVALVELPEGVRMMTNVVDCPAESVIIGMAVKIRWQPLADGRHLPLFAPV